MKGPFWRLGKLETTNVEQASQTIRSWGRAMEPAKPVQNQMLRPFARRKRAGNVALPMLLLLLLPVLVSAEAPSRLKPVYLRCEYRVDPIGMDQSQPRLSWIVESNGPQRGKRQSAYQIQVASTIAKLAHNQGDLWDSGKQDSDESAQVIYTGAFLKSATEYFWKVKVWDEQDAPSAWSGPARWTTGLQRTDWGAQWISDPDIRVSPEVEAESLKGVNSGYLSNSSRDPDTVKWVGVDLGTSFPWTACVCIQLTRSTFRKARQPFLSPSATGLRWRTRRTFRTQP